MHGVGAAPCRVRVETALDRAGQAALIAMPEEGRPDMADDPKLREITCDPRGRKMLVTDGKTSVGQAIAHALARRGRRHGLGRPCRALEEDRRD